MGYSFVLMMQRLSAKFAGTYALKHGFASKPDPISTIGFKGLLWDVADMF
ncbi:MAG: hypothetical protein AB3N12_12565 [Ruegeria sp.]